MSATYDDLEQFFRREKDIRLWGEARERIAALEGELAAANAAKEQFAEVFGCRHESLLDYAHDAAELKQAEARLAVLAKALQERMDQCFTAWEADRMAADYPCKPHDEACEDCNRDRANLSNRDVTAMVERHKAGEEALAEVDGLKPLVGRLEEACRSLTDTVRSYRSDILGLTVGSCDPLFHAPQRCDRDTVIREAEAALSAVPESLAREWQEGREAVEMLDWLDQHWDYGIDEPPLYVADVTPLREALRSAIAGKGPNA